MLHKPSCWRRQTTTDNKAPTEQKRLPRRSMTGEPTVLFSCGITLETSGAAGVRLGRKVKFHLESFSVRRCAARMTLSPINRSSNK